MRVRAARRLVISHQWIGHLCVSYLFSPAQCRFVWTISDHLLDRREEILLAQIPLIPRAVGAVA